VLTWSARENSIRSVYSLCAPTFAHRTDRLGEIKLPDNSDVSGDGSGQQGGSRCSSMSSDGASVLSSRLLMSPVAPSSRVSGFEGVALAQRGGDGAMPFGRNPLRQTFGSQETCRKAIWRRSKAFEEHHKSLPTFPTGLMTSGRRIGLGPSVDVQA